jgi:hypothetical protein
MASSPAASWLWSLTTSTTQSSHRGANAWRMVAMAASLYR